MSQILVVDDEVGIRELLSEILRDEGHQVRLAQNAGEARQIRGRLRPGISPTNPFRPGRPMLAIVVKTIATVIRGIRWARPPRSSSCRVWYRS